MLQLAFPLMIFSQRPLASLAALGKDGVKQRGRVLTDRFVQGVTVQTLRVPVPVSNGAADRPGEDRVEGMIEQTDIVGQRRLGLARSARAPGLATSHMRERLIVALRGVGPPEIISA